MRMFIFLMIMIITVLSQGQAKDMQKYLSDTEMMVIQGKHKEALERYIWFHDHALEHDPAMSGVRRSFALGSWKDLGDVYLPARKAMEETRDRKTQEIRNNKGSASLFYDVMAFNRTLGEDDRTVDLFKHLDSKHPKLAKKCWNAAKEKIIKAGHYDLARKYVGNLVHEFTKAKAMYDYSTTLYEREDIGGNNFKTWNENHLVEQSLLLIDVAIALGDRKTAKEIQEKALAVVDDKRLLEALPLEVKTNAPESKATENHESNLQ